MRILYFLFFYLVTIASQGQQKQLRAFVRNQIKSDSTSQVLITKIARERKLPLLISDSVGAHKILLVTDQFGKTYYRTTLNLDAAQTTGAATLSDISLGYQLLGEEMVCGVWDDGLLKDHVELGNRILSKEGTSFESHAMHVVGTILASGVNTQAKGMAPKAKAYTYFFDNDLSEMSLLASEDDKGLLFSNHSYGTVTGWARPNGVWTWFGDASISNEEDYKHGFYNQRASKIDELAFLAPYYTIVWAAGNDRFDSGDGSRPADCNKGTGYDCIIPDAVGKNIITVGAVQKVTNYTSPTSVVMSHFSSWGPTDDGRIKPDVVGAGMDIFSLSADGENTYTYSTGTSMAAPNVTGSLMLLQELYAKLYGGNYMRASTIKALVIHTAKEAGPKPGPDYQFGWGLLDVKAAADFLIAKNDIDTKIVEGALQNGSTYSFEITPQVNKKVTLTLCWTDPQGTPTSPSLDPLNAMLVNDLDIRLVDEQGIVTMPWILNPSTPQAQATQGDNIRDNVEKIEFETPLNKKYTVLVKHKGTLKFNRQDFSLIVSYQDKNVSAKTFYWIGTSGNWNDATHWSFTSGGTAAGVIPQSTDVVIIDEISLNNGGIINITSDVAINSFRCLSRKDISIQLNGNTLNISKELSLANPSTQIRNGRVNFATTGNGIVRLSKSNLTTTNFSFAGGSWQIMGEGIVGDITLNEGNHNWSSLKLEAKSIQLFNPTLWDITKAHIESREIVFPQTQISLISTEATILINEDTNLLSLNGNSFDGTLHVDVDAELILQTTGKVNNAVVYGNLKSRTDFSFNSLYLEKGSAWQLQNATHQTIEQEFVLNGDAVNQIIIQADVNATLVLSKHAKICLDYVNVSNVDVEGLTVLVVGPNSTIQNGNNWFQEDCESTLFADFSFKFSCVGGLTNFIDRSVGNVTSWLWTFNDASSTVITSNLQNPQITFPTSGPAEVTLLISDGVKNHSYTHTVSITENGLPDNEIIPIGNGQLMSLISGYSYDWFVDKQLINDSNQRILQMNDEPGAYEVVIADEVCNRISSPYLLTAFSTTQQPVFISPNPAQNYFTIDFGDQQFYEEGVLINTKGETVLEFGVTEMITISHIPSGIYIVCLKSVRGKQLYQKVVISH